MKNINVILLSSALILPFSMTQGADQEQHSLSDLCAAIDQRQTDAQYFYEQGRAAFTAEIVKEHKTQSDQDARENLYKKAAGFFEQAAQLGHEAAQYDLAYLYRNGFGVKQDLKKSLELYTSSAEAGYVLAQIILACAYERGEDASRKGGSRVCLGVKQNLQEALRLSTLAVDQVTTRTNDASLTAQERQEAAEYRKHFLPTKERVREALAEQTHQALLRSAGVKRTTLEGIISPSAKRGAVPYPAQINPAQYEILNSFKTTNQQ